MAGDEASTPAVELTLGLSTISRQEYHAFRRREARMKQMRKTKFAAGDRRRLLSPAQVSMRRPKNSTAAAIPVMPMQCAYPAVALHYMPCGGSPYGLPYVVPCWTTPVVGPVVDAESRAVLPTTAAAGKEGAGDEKSSSEFLHFSGEENTAAVTCGSNETKAEKLFDDSSSKNKKKEMEEKMPYVTAKGDGPEGKTISGFLYRYTKAEVSIICVCHGRSFSPAEFLRHAGNSHTSQPHRHIVVVSSPARSK